MKAPLFLNSKPKTPKPLNPKPLNPLVSETLRPAQEPISSRHVDDDLLGLIGFKVSGFCGFTRKGLTRRSYRGVRAV